MKKSLKNKLLLKISGGVMASAYKMLRFNTKK